ncbi:putative acetylxylan esterase [Fusarium sp. NRRL 25303]|nr:putative acetylxylan esterase [Fusarium sp. NRRL 25303]
MQLTSIISFWALALFSLVLAAEPVPRGQLTQVNSYGNNPTGTKMFLYVPKNLKSNPAVVVALHYCGGTGQAYYQGTKWASNAEKYGFIVVYPQTPYSGGCWDVSSKMTLTHEGGGCSTSVANMAKYVLKQYNGDAKKVFVTGESSGAMMTNVMLATYPDVFAAGSAYAGVPAGCFVSQANQAAAWNSTCSQGKSIYTQTQWANVVKNMYPGYNGARPKFQIYHGTADPTLNVQNYYEEIKQWTGIFGYSSNPQSSTPNTPASPYTRQVFGEKFQAFLGQGIGHGNPHFDDNDLKWFGFIVSHVQNPTEARN